MPELVFQSLVLETDRDGFIQDFEAWSEELAQFLATSASMGELTPDHFTILYFLRKYYGAHELAPPIRVLCKETGFPLRRIYQLFPAGPARGACKIAGLPKPTGCS